MEQQTMYELIAIATTMLATITTHDQKPINHPVIQKIVFNNAMMDCRLCGEFCVHATWKDALCVSCYFKQHNNSENFR